jgi:hypothetical protein
MSDTKEQISKVKIHIVGLKDAIARYYEASQDLTKVLHNCNQLEGMDFLEDVDSSIQNHKHEILENLYALLGRLEMEKGEA